MPRGSSPKRERQYEHIKESALDRGESKKRAEEIAGRTVNKERARSGESKTASKSSTQGKSSSQRGGERSRGGSSGGSRGGSEGQTYDQLYAEAKRRDIHGRSSMNKEELKRSLDK
ncbi:plasmid stabilization protein [Streptomyces sp. NPDC015346]|uniref:plasmid stabilization protein n=1 Tax=Streptomyces sp. NPDC015346 TaxID=3364954 RepID=UPI0036FFAF65